MIMNDMEARGARGRIYQAALRLFGERGGEVITVSELADTAGIARGTIYNNIDAPDDLLGEVASALSREMLSRTEATMAGLEDPVERLSTGMRLFIRRAHEEHDWGRFMVRFTLTHSTLQTMMREPPARDIRRAIELERFEGGETAILSLSAMLTGTTLAMMNAVVCGDQAWRRAGSDAARLFLRAGGVAACEAERLANLDLPALAAASPLRRSKTENKS